MNITIHIINIDKFMQQKQMLKLFFDNVNIFY